MARFRIVEKVTLKVSIFQIVTLYSVNGKISYFMSVFLLFLLSAFQNEGVRD